VIALKVSGGGDSRVLVKDYQLDPVSHQLLHADFYQVAMDRVIQVTIPILVKGEAKGIKQQGGILEFVKREIEIECLPGDIPEGLEVDVSELLLHQGIRLKDVAVNPKWTPLTDPDSMLVHVIMPKAEEAPAPAAEGAGAAATPAAAPSRKSSRRARRKTKRKTRRSSEADCGPGQSRVQVPRHPPQHRFEWWTNSHGAAGRRSNRRRPKRWWRRFGLEPASTAATNRCSWPSRSRS
jgi:large subunit ribosomal protein L25